jgi:hypothetical protein
MTSFPVCMKTSISPKRCIIEGKLLLNNINFTGGERKKWVLSLPLKVSMVGEERISRGIEFQIAGAEQRKERKPKSMLDEVGLCPLTDALR